MWESSLEISSLMGETIVDFLHDSADKRTANGCGGATSGRYLGGAVLFWDGIASAVVGDVACAHTGICRRGTAECEGSMDIRVRRVLCRQPDVVALLQRVGTSGNCARDG